MLDATPSWNIPFRASAELGISPPMASITWTGWHWSHSVISSVVVVVVGGCCQYAGRLSSPKQHVHDPFFYACKYPVSPPHPHPTLPVMMGAVHRLWINMKHADLVMLDGVCVAANRNRCIKAQVAHVGIRIYTPPHPHPRKWNLVSGRAATGVFSNIRRGVRPFTVIWHINFQCAAPRSSVQSTFDRAGWKRMRWLSLILPAPRGGGDKTHMERVKTFNMKRTVPWRPSYLCRGTVQCPVRWVCSGHFEICLGADSRLVRPM